MAQGGRGGKPPMPAGWQALKGQPPRPGAGDPLAPILARGMALYRAGQWRDSGLAFQQVLAVDPRHAEASHGLGLALHQMGNNEPAARLITRAIEQFPRRAPYHANLGLVLLSLGRAQEAVESYRKALRLEPDVAGFHVGLSTALLALGRAEEASQAARRAVVRKPDLADAHAALGRALAALARSDEAIASLQKAVTLQRGYLEAQVWLGDALAGSDRLDDAAAAYRTAAAIRPDHAPTHLGLAAVLARLGRHEGAADNYRAAIYLAPSAVAYAGLAREQLALQQPDEAAELLRLALRLTPGDRDLTAELDALLTRLGREAAGAPPETRPLSDLEREEAQFRMAVSVTPGNPVALGNLASALASMGRLEEAIGYYREALRHKPDYFFAWSELLFAINYLGDLPVSEMVAEARRYGELVRAAIAPRIHHPNDRDPARRLRIGLVSADFHLHPVGRFLAAVLAEIDPAQLELFAYYNATQVDGLTESIKAAVPNWRQVEGLSDDDLDRLILADGIDILVDLSGHSAHNRLLVFARKPAPIAITWLGYFATTGLAAMDYVFANDWVIPTAEEGQWVERPWRLPDTYLCFSPPRLAVPLAPPPALANGFITFGSANNINKLNDGTAACWAAVLKAVPNSRLLLRSRPLSDAPVAEKVRSRFAALGIGDDQLVLQGAENDYARHLERYNDVDIALDPFPYAGGTTSVEALWMGVPVLTLKGDRYVAHMGENILHNIGMPEWIAADSADYVRKAAAFAAEPSALAAQRQNLRHRLLVSPLCDAPAFARNLERAFRGMWEKWCAEAPAS